MTSPNPSLALAAQAVDNLLRGAVLPEPLEYEQFGEYHDLVWQLNLMAALGPNEAQKLWARAQWECPTLATLVQGFHAEGLVEPKDLFTEMQDWYERGIPRGVSPGWASLAQDYRVMPGESTVITGTSSSGKALALDTLIPTVNGWTTMGEIAAGDTVFDEKGVPCRVLRVTEVIFERPCFQLTFSDGTTVVADADHQWVTRNEQARNSHAMAQKRNRLVQRPLQLRGTDQSYKRTYPQARTTREIAQSLRTTTLARQCWNHCVAVAEALELPDIDLPIDPYVLGLWLGDGDSKAASMTAHVDDIPFYLHEIWEAGYYTNVRMGSTLTSGRISVSCVPPRRGYHQGSLKAILRSTGVLRNKHIPVAYLRGSFDQRFSLLQGLMDTDGYVSPQSGTCEFTTIRSDLADGIAELIATLGWRVTIKQGQATLYGRVIGPKYRVNFTPDRPVFRLPRKAILCKSRTPKTKQRQIIAVEPVESVPVKCIEVDSPTHQYLCTKAFIPTHNSRFVSAMMVNIAKAEGWHTLMISPEMMPVKRHLEVLLTQYVGKPFDRRESGRMSWAEAEEGLQWLQQHFTWLWPKGSKLTIAFILQMAKQQALLRGTKAVVLDPWNRLSHKNRHQEATETTYIGECLDELFESAQTYSYHQFIVAHPTKVFKDATTGKFPVVTPNMISGSSCWWSMPDNVLSIRRDLGNDEDRTTEIHIPKVRWEENGRMGRRVDLYYHRTTRRYSEMVSEMNPYAMNGRGR